MKNTRSPTYTRSSRAWTSQCLDEFSEHYNLVTNVYRAPTIKITEAAKVIENVQRNLNIAFMNEISMIFARLGIDTEEVLKAAGTKWNFHHYRPGLVRDHCFPVDPYYRVEKANGGRVSCPSAPHRSG